MRFATYLKDGSPVVGAVDDDDKSVRALHRRSDGRPVRDLADVIAGWPAAAEELSPDGDPEALDLVRLLPPLRTGRNIICVGRNYRDHAAEFSQSGFDASDPAASAGDTAPPVPVIFTKAAGCLIAHGEPIDPHPEVTSSLDYEGELAVIIGTGGSDIPAGEAWRHVCATRPSRGAARAAREARRGVREIEEYLAECARAPKAGPSRGAR